MQLTARQSVSRARGFSLVEVAIVLVVISVILGAVLQGYSLIESAEYKAFRQQLTEYRSAFNNFRDRYDALPGDFDEAATRLGLDASDNGNGNGIIGNDTGVSDDPACASGDDGEENCLAWQHLRAAGMLSGNPTASADEASPENAYGGVVSSFFTGNQGNNEFGHKLLVTDIPVDIAIRLDRDEDDEQCNDGRVSLQPRSNCSGTDWPDSGTVDMVYVL